MNHHRAVRVLLLGVLVVLLLGLPAYAYATEWNLAEDFLERGDDTEAVIKDQAGNDVWYLKYSDVALDPTQFVLFPDWTENYSWLVQPVPAGLKGWTVGTDGVPHISVNGTDAELTSNTSPVFTWPAGAVFTHPGPAGSDTAFTVVEWKSPVEGNATVSATLTDADVAPGGSGFQFWIRHNGEGLVVGSVVEGGTESVSLSDVAVLQGESLYLVVGPGTSHSWDSTHLVSLTVSVPEPPVVSSPASSPWSLAILVAIGAAAVPVLRRRRA